MVNRQSGQAKKHDATNEFRKIHAGTSNVLSSVIEHKFTDEKSKHLINPLLETTNFLLIKYETLYPELESLMANTLKLAEAAKGLNAEDADIQKATDVNEIARTINFEELPQIPIVDFSKFLSEPASFFKQLATLQAKTRELRNLLVEMQRKSAKLRQIRDKLNALVNELQNVEPAVDLSMALNDWRKKSDRFFARLGGIATVSTKQ